MRSPCWVCTNCETENSIVSQLCEICGMDRPDPVVQTEEDSCMDDTVAYVNPKSVPKIVKSPKNPYANAEQGVWDKVTNWLQEHPLVPTIAALLLLFLMVYLLGENET